MFLIAHMIKCCDKQKNKNRNLMKNCLKQKQHVVKTTKIRLTPELLKLKKQLEQIKDIRDNLKCSYYQCKACLQKLTKKQNPFLYIRGG